MHMSEENNTPEVAEVAPATEAEPATEEKAEETA